MKSFFSLLFLALLPALLPALLLAQAKYTLATDGNLPISNFENVQYIGNGKAAAIYQGEVYEITFDENYNYKINFIENSGINQNGLASLDVDVDGTNDILSWGSSGGGLYPFLQMPDRFSLAEKLFTSTVVTFADEDYDDDGKNELIINGHVYRHNEDGSVTKIFNKSPSNLYVYENPYFIDIDQDGDKDVLFNLVTNIGYLENKGTDRLFQTLISQFNHSCGWMQVIETADGPKIIYHDIIDNSVKRIIPDAGTYTTKTLLEDYPNNGYKAYVSDVNEDGNEEIVLHTDGLNRIYLLDYDLGLDTMQIREHNFMGREGIMFIEDMGRPKIAGFNESNVQIYEFDTDLNLNLLHSGISTLILYEGSFVDLDGDDFVDMYNTSLYKKYFGADEFGNVQSIQLPDVGGQLMDFDGDKDADYVLDDIWYENSGNLEFGDAQINPNGPAPYPDPNIFFTNVIFEQDLDDDGDTDLLSYNSFGEPLLLHENINNETFLEGVELADFELISGNLQSIQYLDLNGDGLKDILMATASGMVWFQQTGTLTYTASENLYDEVQRIQSLEIADGDFDGYPDIVIGSGGITMGSAFGEAVLFKGSDNGPTAPKAITLPNAGYKKAQFLNSDDEGALDILVSSDGILNVYRISSYDNLIPIEQLVTNNYSQYGSFQVMDVDGDSDEDIIIYDEGGINVAYLLKNENSIPSQCPTDDIIMLNQQQVDNFQERYGSCPNIKGDMVLGIGSDWADIDDLDAFINVEEIQGSLVLDQINQIDSYQGFQNLVRIGGDFHVDGHKIADFGGFENVRTIGGDFIMRNVFTGFGGVGDFRNFESLDSLGGGINLRWSAIRNIDNLILGNKINGDFILENPGPIIQLDSLINIDTIQGEILIQSVDVFDLSILRNIKYFEGLLLSDLPYCSKISILPQMDSLKGDISIGLPQETNFQYNDNLRYIGGQFSLNLKQPGTWSNLVEVGQRFNYYSPSLDSPSFNKLKRVGDTFSVSASDSYDYSNFSNLEYVGGTFVVSSIAKSLDGLEKLDTIGSNFSITFTALKDMSALDDDLYVGDTWNIYNNEFLSTCDITPLCNHIRDLKPYNISNNAAGCYEVSEIKCLENSITGVAFYDYNKDGIRDEATDAPLSNIILHFNNSIDSVVTSNDGAYRKFLVAGDYFKVAAEEFEDWEFTTANEYVIDSFIPFVTGLEDRNFGMVPKTEQKEIFTSINSSIFLCDRPFDVDIFMKNKGTALSVGYLQINYSEEIELDPDFTDYTSHDLVNKEIIIDYDELYPYFTEKIQLPFIAPNAEEINNPNLNIQVKIFDTSDPSSPELVTEKQINLSLLCSYDPNDKLVSTTDGSGNIRINEDDEIIYTIRFQNTGNYFAEDIRITDEISQNLDLSTFQFIDASHDVQIFIRDRMVTFLFDDIWLIDSTSNLTESQGYVSFSIRPISYELGLEIDNEANIFFDFNDPILTNTASSVVYDPTVGVQDYNTITPILFPQPAHDYLNVSLDNYTSTWDYLILNAMGSKVLSGALNDSGSIDVRNLTSGIYYLKLSDKRSKNGVSAKFSIVGD